MSKQTVSSTPPEIYDVVVISAGSVKVETVFGLRQHGIKNIFVIDRTRAFRQVRQVTDLLTNKCKKFITH